MKTYLVDFTVDEPQHFQLEVQAKNKREARIKAKEEIGDQYATRYGIDRINEMEPEGYDED